MINDNGRKYAAINTISLYISQLLNNKEYNNALNTYSECLQTILNTILIKTDCSHINSSISNLINNETNIHTIIVYSMQMMNEKHYFDITDFSVIDNNSLLKDIFEIKSPEQALIFIRTQKKWLYFNCNFKNFLIKIVDLNLLNTSNMDRKAISYWKDIYEEITS